MTVKLLSFLKFLKSNPTQHTSKAVSQENKEVYFINVKKNIQL